MTSELAPVSVSTPSPTRVVVAVPDLPRTCHGELSGFAARDAVHGRPAKTVGALEHPEVLAHRNWPELRG